MAKTKKKPDQRRDPGDNGTKGIRTDLAPLHDGKDAACDGEKDSGQNLSAQPGGAQICHRAVSGEGVAQVEEGGDKGQDDHRANGQ